MIGSSRTTNEENYLLQKFARVVLETNNVDHHRTADFPAFAAALQRQARCHGFDARGVNAPAILLIGNDPTEQHPLLAWQIRNNVRLHRARLYVINSQDIKLRTAGGQLHACFRQGAKASGAFLAGEMRPSMHYRREDEP